MTDDKKELDSHDALLKSLESIKTLLAQSEDKLSAARESLSQANKGASMKEKEPDQDIPVLDEVVEAGEQIKLGMQPHDMDDLPALTSVAEEDAVNLVDEERLTQTNDIEATDFDLSAANITPVLQEMPDLSGILRAIDEIEGAMKDQINIAAKVFEEQLNQKLDEKLQALREEVHRLLHED